MNIVLAEIILLFLNLIAILILVVLQKRTAAIILISIAILQVFLLHWNTVLNSLIFILR